MFAYFMKNFFLFNLLLIIIFDLKERKISNYLIFPALVAIFMLAIFQKATPFGATLSGSLFGFAAGLIFLLPFYVLRIMGAADVKLFAVAGALFGAGALVPLWLMASGLAGGHALVWLALQRWMAGGHAGTVKALLGWRFSSAAREAGAAAPAAQPQAAPTNRTLPYGAHLAIAMMILALRPQWLEAITPHFFQ